MAGSLCGLQRKIAKSHGGLNIRTLGFYFMDVYVHVHMHVRVDADGWKVKFVVFWLAMVCYLSTILFSSSFRCERGCAGEEEVLLDRMDVLAIVISWFGEDGNAGVLSDDAPLERLGVCSWFLSVRLGFGTVLLWLCGAIVVVVVGAA